MSKRKSFWITLLKKILLAITHLYLLYPIIQLFVPLNQFENDWPMLIFSVGSALLAVLVPFWFIWFPLQIGLVFYTYQRYFPVEDSGMEWLQTHFDQLTRALSQFLQGDLAIFPTNVALFLILLLLSLATYLLITKMKPSYIVLTCLIYLMILHVFTQYDFFPFVVQVLAMSVLLLGITQVPVNQGWRQALLSFTVVTVVGFFFTRIALWGTEQFVPQQQWVENKARDYQRRLENAGVFDFVDYYSSGGGLQRMGYGENDTELGGPVQQNFEHVFTAYDDTPHYWRISTRDFYNGRGWEEQHDSFILPLEYAFSPAASEENATNILIERQNGFRFFPYTYQMFGLDSGGNEDWNVLVPSMKLEYQGEEAFNNYEITIANREINFAALNEVDFSQNELQTADIYLQLPENIPGRVWDLANEITAEAETPYQKIRAIEQYLRSGSGLRYSLREAAHLPEGEEYIDHFLFESQVGYCDNFSTTMVVMARMLGIPARWAKGFNSGVRHTEADGQVHYEVSNANAHSWPEVYFPGYGWIPFEPTPAFNQPLTDVVPGAETVENPGSQFADDVWEEEPAPLNPNDMSEETPTTPGIPVQQEEEEQSKGLGRTIVTILVIGLTLLIYVSRRKIYPFLIGMLVRLPFLSVRLKIKLIWSLYWIEKRKKPSETLRQYFMPIAKKQPLHQQAVRSFVQLNETILYAPEGENHIERSEAKEVLLGMIPVYQDIQLSKQKSSF